MDVVVLEAGHTHFYPGHEGWLEGDAPALDDGERTLPSRIVFADGTTAGGTLKLAGDGWELEVAPYVTAAGTDIGAKRWSITFRSTPDRRTSFRIDRKLASRND